MKTHAIIVAAGTGSRTGLAQPKQFEKLAGKPLFQWSIDAFLASANIESIVVVMPQAVLSEPELVETAPSRVKRVEGGATRSKSVRNGLRAIDAGEDDIVLIHDAARPGLDGATIETLVEALKKADAAAPALPVSDALKRSRGDTLETVSRDNLYRIQTPQAFRYGLISKAHEQQGESLVDDLAAVETLGIRVELVPGSQRLDKITFKEDFARMEAILKPVAAPPVRIGSGYDVHAFEEGDGITLCGIRIPFHQGLAGHSDADVGWHALTDAIFGALALGDLGDHFPPSDPKWKDADSAVFLKHALSLASEAGWQLGNCDITVICEAPKIKPHREAMRQATADLAGLPLDCVSLKATTTEGLGFTGRREGIAAQATALLVPAAHSHGA
ncbi:bifunctional 2-C-methyl-D-erythritol 4-phosphate cytidylyltransferase/2-C-methyl-D-erythritol 2,4-cyclodiphosphate synthase [Henriciella aquimarina]|uniref:bifunctional 2-C-methyl-D-erythritol 4-phosphate cytidylyltransferase/2-C-methyl-D-erythritol 2,4-cyclodiphosphate synthase n=1 Tax=Henriciella aquimarina TaxID=545261 RepID=UPI000A019559|nr:bifunctional 2-C-methyl-D-erythritol 4-phosphate cytidylyltransferase/2-C-methyl-D-erythritol 2,4-cyclodiphosphate synthase [Henriciella aquimarina]